MDIIDYIELSEILSLCAKYYKPDTFQHCLRVARYAVCNKLVKETQREAVFIVAMCHDLLNYTNVTIDEICEAAKFSEDFIENVLDALTQKKSEIYMDYIKRIKMCTSEYSYIIKLADIKDHLTHSNSLTDESKEKYLSALTYLI